MMSDTAILCNNSTYVLLHLCTQGSPVQNDFHGHQGGGTGSVQWSGQIHVSNQWLVAFQPKVYLLYCHFQSNNKNKVRFFSFTMHSGPIGYTFPSPIFSCMSFLPPIHSPKGSKPKLHASLINFAANISAHIIGSPAAAVKPNMVKCASFMAAHCCSLPVFVHKYF
jgi:hypothetical protein